MYPVPTRLPKGANIRRLSRQEYPLKPQTSSTYSSDIAYPKNSECRHSLSFNCSPRAEPSGFTQTHVQYSMQRWIDDTEGDRVIADINFNPRSSNFGVCQNNPRSSLSATDHETDSTSASEWTKSHTETAHSDGFSTDEAVLNYLGAWCSDEVKRYVCREGSLKHPLTRQFSEMVSRKTTAI